MRKRAQHYCDLARKAATLPPQVVARKVACRISAPVAQSVRRQRDRLLPTSCIGRGSHPVTTVLRRIASPPSSLLAPHAEPLRVVSQHYREHRFNLLGSGWVNVGYGAVCNGLAGHRYPPAEPVDADRAGNWLSSRVPRSFAATARQIWQLVDSDYQPIDWQLDFKSGYRWSSRTWHRDIRYGHAPGVDVKVPWELARMQHLPQLALAHSLAITRAAGFSRPALYAREFRNQVLDFVAANPPRFGVNWACTMDVALRAANWLLAYDLFRAAGATFDERFKQILLDSLFDHGRHIANHLEWCEIARGNHYLADIVGLLFLAAYLPPCEETDRWLVVATHEFVRECGLQFRPDGTNFEGSTCYHRLSTEMAVFGTAVLLGLESNRLESIQRGLSVPWRRGPRIEVGSLSMSNIDGRRMPFTQEHLVRISRAAQFTQAITKPSGQVVQVGDNDSGRFTKLTPVLDRNSDPRRPSEDTLDHGSLVAQVAGLFSSRALPDLVGKYACDEYVVRALAGGGVQRNYLPHRSSPPLRAVSPSSIPTTAQIVRREYEVAAAGDLLAGLQRHAFEDFGLYVYRSSRIFLAIRCGGRGQITTGGHEHCDQLAIELEIDGQPVVRDPGTFSYTPLPEERNRYRAASAHFVPHFGTIDRELYPENLEAGLFQLPAIRRADCIAFQPDAFVGRRQVGERTITRRVEISASRVRIIDECTGADEPSAAIETWRSIPFSPAYGIQQHHRIVASTLVEVTGATTRRTSTRDSRRVVVVTERFPPANDPRALRWGAIVRHWRAQGIQAHVVSPAHMAAKTTPQSQRASITTNAKRFLKAIYRHTWGKLWWPDYACLWQLVALRKTRALLDHTRFDAIVTVSNPFSDHLVGLAIKRQYPSLRWLADLGDPFSLDEAPAVNNRLIYGRWNARLERAVFQHADVVAVTNEATSNAYRRRYPEVADKIRVIPPLFSCAAAPPCPARSPAARRHLVYAGRLYCGLRSPAPLLSWFRELLAASNDDWHLHFFGDSTECRHEFLPYANLIGRRIWLHGAVDHGIVQRALREADVLANLGNDNPHQVPSKLVEYMATGRPILNFIARTPDTSTELLRAYPAQHSVRPFESAAECERAIRFVTRQHATIEPTTLSELLAPFSIDSVAAEYRHLLFGNIATSAIPGPHMVADYVSPNRSTQAEPAGSP